MPDIDWSELQRLADDEKFTVLPEGQTYVFVCEKADIKNTASGNGVNVSLKCKVAEGPDAGHVTFANIFIAAPGADVKAGAYGMMAAKLNAVGVPLSVLAQHNATPQQAATLFTGKMFLGTVEHREWPKGSGNVRDGIGTIAPLPAGGGQQFMPGMTGAPASRPPAVASANGDSSIPAPGEEATAPPKAPW